MIHISDCLQLSDCPHDYDWFAEMNEYGIVECTTEGLPQRNYKLDVLPHQLSAEKRVEVLDSNLGVGMYDDNECVTIRDLFMHGEYITYVAS